MPLVKWCSPLIILTCFSSRHHFSSRFHGVSVINIIKKQVVLYDEGDKLLESRFVKKDDVIKSGETLAFDCYLVDIGEGVKAIYLCLHCLVKKKTEKLQRNHSFLIATISRVIQFLKLLPRCSFFFSFFSSGKSCFLLYYLRTCIIFVVFVFLFC